MAAKLLSNSDVTRRPGQAMDAEASPPVAQEEATTASNRGTGHEVYAGMTGFNLEFKTLRAGPNVTITSDADYIDITATGGSGGGGGGGSDNFLGLTDTPDSYAGQAGKVVSVKGDASGLEFTTPSSSSSSGEANTSSNLGAGTGVYAQKSGVDLQLKSLKASGSVSLSSTSTEITITGSGEANTTSNSGTGEGTIAKAKSGVDLPLKSLKAGSNVTITNGADEITIAASGGGSGSGADFGGQYKNLVVTCSGTGYQGTITAGRLVVEDSSFNCEVLRSISLSFNGANSGANGLDTGSMAAGNWYYIYVIYNGTTVASLISLSSISPTLPSGYTKKALVGCARVQPATSAFVATIKSNYYTYYGTSTVDTHISVLSGGTATTITAISLATSVPPECQLVNIVASHAGVSGSGTVYRSSSGSYLGAAIGEVSLFSNAVFINGTQTIYYNVGGGGSISIKVIGYITGF